MTRGIAYDFQFHFINLPGLINLQLHDCTFWIILRTYIREWKCGLLSAEELHAEQSEDEDE